VGAVRTGPDSAPRPRASDAAAPAAGLRAGRAGSVAAWLAVAAWIALVFWLGSGSFGAPNTSHILFPLLRWLFPDLAVRELLDLALVIRKLAHPTVYGVLALLALNAWRLSWPGPPWRSGALACGLCLAVACADEARQTLLPGRTGAAFDVALDLAGALIAVTGTAALVRVRGLWDVRRPQREAARGEP